MRLAERSLIISMSVYVACDVIPWSLSDPICREKVLDDILSNVKTLMQTASLK